MLTLQPSKNRATLDFMDERDELVKELAHGFLSSVIKEITDAVIDVHEWSKEDLLIDVCIECISRIHTAHMIRNPGIGNAEWFTQQILDDLSDRLEYDREETFEASSN